jgi:hypothetical protein
MGLTFKDVFCILLMNKRDAILKMYSIYIISKFHGVRCNVVEAQEKQQHKKTSGLAMIPLSISFTPLESGNEH